MKAGEKNPTRQLKVYLGHTHYQWSREIPRFYLKASCFNAQISITMNSFNEHPNTSLYFHIRIKLDSTCSDYQKTEANHINQFTCQVSTTFSFLNNVGKKRIWSTHTKPVHQFIIWILHFTKLLTSPPPPKKIHE